MSRAAWSATWVVTVPRRSSNARRAVFAVLVVEPLLTEVGSRSASVETDAPAAAFEEVSEANVGGWGGTPVVLSQCAWLPRVSRRLTRWE
jgi:hypothetical protein